MTKSKETDWGAWLLGLVFVLACLLLGWLIYEFGIYKGGMFFAVVGVVSLFVLGALSGNGDSSYTGEHIEDDYGNKRRKRRRRDD